MKIALFGYGKMNRLVASLAKEEGHEICAIFSQSKAQGELKKADIAIDFSSSTCVLAHVKLASQAKIPIVIGTTGWKQEKEAQEIVMEEGTAALYAPNFSVGIYLFYELLKKASTLFQNYEAIGIETHHSKKKDAPSGTAKEIEAIFDNKLPFHSIRIGSHPGKHEVVFDSPYDTIHLVHEARNKEGFAKGALTCANWLIGKKGWYTIDAVYRSLYSTDHSI